MPRKGKVDGMYSSLQFDSKFDAKLQQTLKILLPLAAVAIFLATIWVGSSLRPIADDYGLGASTALGPFSALGLWWENWSGSISTIALQVFLVGIPLHHLPWEVASLVPFLTSAFLVSGFVTWRLSQSRETGRRGKSPVFDNLFSFVLITVLWWSSWWLSTITVEQDVIENPWPRAIAFWQTVNVQYVAVIALVCWFLWAVVARLPRMRTQLSVPITVVASLAVGFAGPVVALSSALTVGIATVAGTSSIQRRNGRSVFVAGLAIAFIATAALADNFSPGSSARKQSLADPTIREIVVALMQTPGKASVVVWDAIFNVGNLLTFLTLGAVAFAGLISIGRTSSRRLLWAGFGLVGFGVVLAGVSIFSQVFAYEAWWHTMSAQTVIWMGISILAAAAGANLRTRVDNHSFRNFSLVVALAGLFLAGSSLGQMAFETQERLKAWEQGPASIEGRIADIESGWVEREWLKLNNIREKPTPR